MGVSYNTKNNVSISSWLQLLHNIAGKNSVANMIYTLRLYWAISALCKTIQCKTLSDDTLSYGKFIVVLIYIFIMLRTTRIINEGGKFTTNVCGDARFSLGNKMIISPHNVKYFFLFQYLMSQRQTGFPCSPCKIILQTNPIRWSQQKKHPSSMIFDMIINQCQSST